MKLHLMNGTRTESFKYPDIVSMATARMPLLKDFRGVSYCNTKQFAKICLKLISKMYSENKSLALKDLEKPQRFIAACSNHFHLRKRRDLSLRTFRLQNVGWIKCRIDRETNPEEVGRIEVQAKDRIQNLAVAHNERVDYDKNALGIETVEHNLLTLEEK